MRTFQYGDTVLVTCLHETYDFDNDVWTVVNPDTGYPKVTIIDPDGVIRISAIKVSDSSTFVVGLTVTGTTSQATGVIIAKPADAKTLVLAEVTGTWESGETITDTGGHSSTTSSALIGDAMAEAAIGKHTYAYEIPASPATGRWTGYVDVINASRPDRQPFVFQVH